MQCFEPARNAVHGAVTRAEYIRIRGPWCQGSGHVTVMMMDQSLQHCSVCWMLQSQTSDDVVILTLRVWRQKRVRGQVSHHT